MSEIVGDSIFWIEVGKIKPNPFQPRHEFDQDRLRDLSDSIRQYGVLQPLVVTRRETQREDGSIFAEYELIAGERRWRASQLAGLSQVPVVIRNGEQSDKLKLEMAIIENLQREDLNPVERAKAFNQLAADFKLKHGEIARKIGRSREYVSNSIRLLGLTEEVLEALNQGQITEGHAKPILMLIDRPEEQKVLFQEITTRKLTVREAEAIARRIAFDKVRKKDRFLDPSIMEMEKIIGEKFGTRVHIERKQIGGKVTIDFFTNDDLQKIIEQLSSESVSVRQEKLEESVAAVPEVVFEVAPESQSDNTPDDTLYNTNNFTV